MQKQLDNTTQNRFHLINAKNETFSYTNYSEI